MNRIRPGTQPPIPHGTEADPGLVRAVTEPRPVSRVSLREDGKIFVRLRGALGGATIADSGVVETKDDHQISGTGTEVSMTEAEWEQAN